MRATPILVLALAACGCTASRPVFSTSTVVKDDSLPVTPRALEQLPIGRYYRLQTTDPKIAYVGQVVRTDGEQVELADVDRETRADSSSPLMANRLFPSFSRLFTRNTGVDVEILDENKTLARTEITGMDLLPPAEVNHRLTVKQRSYQDPPAKVEQAAKKREEGWHAAG